MAKRNLEKLDELAEKIIQENADKGQVIPTNLIQLDRLLGGGFELGNKYQFVAESSCGKSTIALQIASIMCDKGFNVIYLDTENSITKELQNSTGVDKFCSKQVDKGRFILIKKSSFDEVTKTLDAFISTGEISFIVIDSLASLINKCYTNITDKVKDVTNSNTNYESRPIKLFINKYSSLAQKYNICMIYINQYRNKIDMTKGTVLKAFGNKIVRYNSDVILKIKKLPNDIENKNEVNSFSKLEFMIDKSNKVKTNSSEEVYLELGVGINNFMSKIKELLIKKEITNIGNGYYEAQVDGTIYKIHGFMNLYYFLKNNWNVSVDESVQEDDNYISLFNIGENN